MVIPVDGAAQLNVLLINPRPLILISVLESTAPVIDILNESSVNDIDPGSLNENPVSCESVIVPVTVVSPL